MTNKQALRTLLDGGKIKSDIWDGTSYLYMDTKCQLKNKFNIPVDWNEMAHSFADTWEVLEEGKE